MRFLVSLLAVLLVAFINAAPISKPVTEDTSPAVTEDTILAKDTFYGVTEDTSPTGSTSPAVAEETLKKDTSEEKDEFEGKRVKKDNGTYIDVFPLSDVIPGLLHSGPMKSVFENFGKYISGNFDGLLRDILHVSGLQQIPPNEIPLDFPNVNISTDDHKHDHEKHMGNPLIGLPGLLNFPEFQMTNNNTNSTYEVHVLNGTQVEVNRTVSRQSGDGYNAYIEYEMIFLRPEKQPKDQVGTTPLPEEEEKSDEEEEDEKSDDEKDEKSDDDEEKSDDDEEEKSDDDEEEKSDDDDDDDEKSVDKEEEKSVDKEEGEKSDDGDEEEDEDGKESQKSEEEEQ